MEARQVPGTFRGYNYERMWLRRSFTLPASMRGKRIKIQFDGVKYNSRVFVNGKHVGGCFNGYDAFEVDVTDAVRFDEAKRAGRRMSRLDRRILARGGTISARSRTGSGPRRYVNDKVIAPIGGHYDHYGIWGDVTLVAIRTSMLRICSSNRRCARGELVVDYTLANESAEAVEVELRADRRRSRQRSAAIFPR